MVIALVIPRFPLLIALLTAQRPLDIPIALGPAPGDPARIGLCTPPARAGGVVPGLRVGEALARCPELELIAPDPDATDRANERLLQRIEALGAAVEAVAPGIACFESRGLERVHGGRERLLRRVAAALPVGADGRLGVAPSRFVALQAAREAPAREPLAVDVEHVASFLSPLPVARLMSALGHDGASTQTHTPDDPLDEKELQVLNDLGIHTLGELARLPRRSVLDRLGYSGLRAHELARGGPDRRLRPRVPTNPIDASISFPDAVATLPVLHAAAAMLITRVTATAQAHGRAIRALSVHAALTDAGSWSRHVTLREAHSDAERIIAATMPTLDTITAPTTALTVRVDATTSATGRQLSISAHGDDERRRRTREALRHVRASHGDYAIMRIVEVAPHSRLPERRWALAPFDI